MKIILIEFMKNVLSKPIFNGAQVEIGNVQNVCAGEDRFFFLSLLVGNLDNRGLFGEPIL